MMANAQKKSHAAGHVAAQGQREAEPAGEAEEGEVDRGGSLPRRCRRPAGWGTLIQKK